MFWLKHLGLSWGGADLGRGLARVVRLCLSPLSWDQAVGPAEFPWARHKRKESIEVHKCLSGFRLHLSWQHPIGRSQSQAGEEGWRGFALLTGGHSRAAEPRVWVCNPVSEEGMKTWHNKLISRGTETPLPDFVIFLECAEPPSGCVSTHWSWVSGCLRVRSLPRASAPPRAFTPSSSGL